MPAGTVQPPLWGNELPLIGVAPPGVAAQKWGQRANLARAPMGPASAQMAPGLVYQRAFGSNVFDPDGNRYVDLAAGFGAQLLGHCHPEISAAINQQATELTQALGDVFPCPQQIALQERLACVLGDKDNRVILGQSGADAVTAALKTAVLFTGRRGVVSFSASYHGLGYAPLAVSNLRQSYRAPFLDQLNPHVHSVPFPATVAQAEQALDQVKAVLASGQVGAVLIEPILGRGGCIIPAQGFLPALAVMAAEHGALTIMDEIWTGLGRSGSWLYSRDIGLNPDIVCLGKGLGGGLPVSACIGAGSVMAAWQQPNEVVHTSTFAGAPLAAAAAHQTLDILARDGLVTRSHERGAAWLCELASALAGLPAVASVRGRGLMIGIELGPQPGIAAEAMQRLLKLGWIVSTGGGTREVLVLTPPLNISDALLDAATIAICQALTEMGQ
jgi:4-aminobutyrate aminotransferase/(S)-3-amino-2-methylpropionate transaminase